jgi:hypothetical protein
MVKIVENIYQQSQEPLTAKDMIELINRLEGMVEEETNYQKLLK